MLATYEDREWMITEYYEPRIWAFQMMWNAKFEGWECIEAGRQLRAAEETGRARIAAARKRRRDEERQIREEMQSGERSESTGSRRRKATPRPRRSLSAGLRVTEPPH